MVKLKVKLASWGFIEPKLAGNSPEIRWEELRTKREPRILSLQDPKSHVSPLGRHSREGLTVSGWFLSVSVSTIPKILEKRIPLWASLSFREGCGCQLLQAEGKESTGKTRLIELLCGLDPGEWTNEPFWPWDSWSPEGLPGVELQMSWNICAISWSKGSDTVYAKYSNNKQIFKTDSPLLRVRE